jgi:hypothetical protein
LSSVPEGVSALACQAGERIEFPVETGRNDVFEDLAPATNLAATRVAVTTALEFELSGCPACF